MAAPVSYRYQSTYPLQAPFGHSRRSSIATNDSGETRSRRRYSIVSAQGSQSNGCPFKHTTEPPLVAPTAKQLPSPLLNESGDQMWPGGLHDNLPASQGESGSWSRGSYPLHPATQLSDNRNSVISAAKLDEFDDRPNSQMSNASSRSRTLRRSQRSRRIESPVLVHKDSPSTQTNGYPPSLVMVDALKRSSYPPKAIPDSVPGTFQASPDLNTSSHFSDQVAPTGLRLRKDSSTANQQPPSPPSSTEHSTLITNHHEFSDDGSQVHIVQNGQQQQQQQLLENGHSETSSKIWRRREYPLQTPASNTTLRSLPTPPPSPPTEHTQEHTDGNGPGQPNHANKPIEARVAALRRRAYPLQAPASVADLQSGRAELKESEGEVATHVQQPINTSSKSQQDRPVNKSLRRQAYPLQSPASIVDLQHQPAPTLAPGPREAKSEPANEMAVGGTTASQNLPKSVKKSLRRQVYPLQSPASIVDLQQSEPAIVTNDSGVAKKSSPLVAQTQAASPPKPSKSLRRQAYPLQASASVANLQPTETSPAVTREAHMENGFSTLQPESTLEDSQAPYLQTYPTATAANLGFPQQDRATEKPNPASDVLKDRNDGEQSMKHKQTTPLRRQAYPLQAPASAKNLRTEATAQAAVPSLSLATTTEYEAIQNKSRHTKATDDQAYPLQASMIDMDSDQQQRASAPEETDGPTTQAIPQIQIEKDQSPMSPQPLWRRRTYPLNDTEDEIFSRSITPMPPTETRDPDSIRLPKHIPAVRNSDDANFKGRTIVVCLDGTGDKFDSDNSNIVHLVSSLKKDDSRQVTYYQAGIGTYSAGGLSSGFAAAMDMAVGSGLGLHVRDAYHFLMHSYKEGDRICIFGFSRGAYTARCLAGMIHKVGLLPPRNDQQIPFAYEFYANDTPEGWKQSEDFKKTFSTDVNVHFLGCFDSVASVGFIPRQLPLSTTPKNKPLYFRHAMALDERRAKFKICRHQAKKLEEIEGSAPATPTSAIIEAAQSHLPNYKDQKDSPKLYSPSTYGAQNHPNLTDEEYKRLMGPDESFDTDVLEVWFAGAHADVGGGAVANVERHKLAQIPLRWMIRQAFECNTGILFKTKVLAEHGLDVHTLWPKYESLKAPSHGPPPSYLEKYEQGLPPRSIRQSKLVATNENHEGEQLLHLKSHMDDDWTPEQLEDFYDAISPLNDQLIQAPTWWILELWPVQMKVPVAPGKYYIRTGMNLGRYRAVEDYEPNLHWTVLHRMEHMGYKLGVRTTKQTQWKTVV